MIEYSVWFLMISIIAGVASAALATWIEAESKIAGYIALMIVVSVQAILYTASKDEEAAVLTLSVGVGILAGILLVEIPLFLIRSRNKSEECNNE